MRIFIYTMLVGLLLIVGFHPASALPEDALLGETLRVLVAGDPFAVALQNARPTLEAASGTELHIEIASYNDVRRRVLLNALDLESAYDIVSFDVVWAGEYSANNILLPLDDHIASTPALDVADFVQSAYAASRYDRQQLGLPIQPHPELLWYRTDLFDAEGLAPPETTADLLRIARQLHDPARDQYGLCWNAQRGQALGQQMAHFYAAFGQPLLDERGRPTLNTPTGIAAAAFAQSLMAFSPPDIMNMAWDQRVTRFSRGGCAMIYGWGARAAVVEDPDISTVAGKVGYAPAPHAPGSPPITPFGTWSLGIPANVGERENIAWEGLAWLSSAEVQKVLAENGNGGTTRYSILTEPALAERYPFFPLVVELERSQQLKDWMRPPIPQWPNLADILGNVYHDMLLGQITPTEAGERAQQEAVMMFSQHD